jgi:putative ABC transport system permease protein
MTGTMILRIILGLLLLLIPAGVLYLWDKKLLRGLGLGVVRMVGQTLVLCLMVWALLRYDHVWVSLLWLVLLCVYTSGVIITRVKGRLSRLLLPVSIAQIVGTLLPTCYLLTVMLPGTEGFTTRWLVPAGALLMSHITASQIRGLSTYLSAIETDREQYEFLLGNGREHLGAVIPFVRRAVQAILSPSAAQLAVTGLFTMPLLLAGMLLAGVAPLNAFIAMLLFTCGCLAGSVIALILSLWLCDRHLFVKNA